ncbi:unnamed protein product [Blepharisma stoltei]|uniref:Tetratricopeptide repeat protein n=1 Tax=Blepharisma stoltei TaxID=1481888 RepID=A0AAU9JJE4_9CILI|nr:unnamed protein product [Blepharisma stoltei]
MLSMGIAYCWKLDYQKALKFLNKAKKMMYDFIESYKNQLFIAYAYIGELCNLQGKLKYAKIYFTKAIELIGSYDIFNIDMLLKSQSFVFSYFYGKSGYEKCRIILLRVNEILKNNMHQKFRMPCYFIQWAELYISLNEIKEAEKCLSEAEKLLFSQKNIVIKDLDCVGDYIDVANIYINLSNNSDENLQKAEKILKYAEGVVNEKRRNDRFSKLAIYYCLGMLYSKEQRWEYSKIYIQKLLDLYKKFTHNPSVVKDLKCWINSLMNFWKFIERKFKINIQSK